MKSLGELVKEWRTQSGLSTRELADLVGHNVKRQHIEQLEEAGDRLPRYLAHLATAMGTTADGLLAGKMPALHGAPPEPLGVSEPTRTFPAPPAKPAPGFKDPPRDSSWQVLHDLDDLHPDDRASWVNELHRQAEKAREIGRMQAEKALAPMKATARSKKT